MWNCGACLFYKLIHHLASSFNDWRDSHAVVTKLEWFSINLWSFNLFLFFFVRSFYFAMWKTKNISKQNNFHLTDVNFKTTSSKHTHKTHWTRHIYKSTYLWSDRLINASTIGWVTEFSNAILIFFPLIKIFKSINQTFISKAGENIMKMKIHRPDQTEPTNKHTHAHKRIHNQTINNFCETHKQAAYAQCTSIELHI